MRNKLIRLVDMSYNERRRIDHHMKTGRLHTRYRNGYKCFILGELEELSLMLEKRKRN